MLRFALLLVLLCVCVDALAQQATLRGFIADGSNGQPLELVNVVLASESDVRGTTTDADGLYQFSRVPAGAYEIRATFIGFGTFRDSLVLVRGRIHTFNFVLESRESALDELIVEARAEATIHVPVAGLQTVRPAEINRIPTPDVTGDLAAQLSVMPGIVAVGDQGGQLFIRGGEPTQNMVLLDGMLVYQPFHILGFYSAFPSGIISKADIYAGGFGSKYGGRLSSVIDIRTRDGNLRSVAASGAVSPFLGSLLVEGPVIPDRISLLASFRQSLLDELAAQYIRDDLPFTFNDGFGKLRIDLSATSRLTLTYLKTMDQGNLADDTGDRGREQTTWTNEAMGFRLLFLPKNFAAAIELSASHSRLRNTLGPANALVRRSDIENTHVILEAVFSGQRANITAGSDLRPTVLSSQLGGLYQNTEFRDARVANWGNYLEADIKIGSNLRVVPSIRAQFYRVRFNPYLEPRLRAVWNRGGHQVSAATGTHHQEILGLNDRRDAANVFTAWTNIPSEEAQLESILAGRIQRAIHGILGYSYATGAGLSVSAEGFYKKLSNLFIAEWTAIPRLTTRLQPASGRSAGFDARLAYRRGAIDAQVNYAFSATRYYAEQASLPIWYGVESLDFRPPHDRRHHVNALISTRLSGFELTARWAFGSGFPFSRAVGFDGFALIEDIVDVGRIPTSRRVIYERPFSSRLPDYHRLDVSIARALELNRARVSIRASVLNAYDRANIFYLDVFTLRRVNQLPIVPSLGIEVAFE